MSKEDSSQVSRREVLATGKTAAAVAAAPWLSGCGGNGSERTGTSAQGVGTPSNAGTDTSGNNNQRNAPTGQGQDQDSTNGRNETGQGQDQDSTNGRNETGQGQNPSGEEIDIPDWEDADDLYETQKLIYKDAEDTAAQCAFTVDPDYIDGSELEPTKYEGEPTLEHKLKDVLDGNVEYRGEMEELTVIVQKPNDDHGDSGIHVYNDSGLAANVGATDSNIESQIDALEHVDAEGVEHSSDLLEYVERELN